MATVKKTLSLSHSITPHCHNCHTLTHTHSVIHHTQQSDHGNGVFICHSFSNTDRRIGRYLKNIWRERRFRAVASQDIETWRREEHSEECISIADIFIVIISPYFSHSRHCQAQIALALKYSKLVIPVVFEEVVNMDEAYPAALQNKEPIYPELDPKRGITRKVLNDLTGQILEEMQPLRIYIRAHTRILLRAMMWDLREFDKCFLLRDDDVTRANNWLIQQHFKSIASSAIGIGPTVLHLSFIAESRRMQRMRESRKCVFGIVVALLMTCCIFPSFGIFFCCAVSLHVLVIVDRV